MGPANEQRSYVITNATGTLGYCDPMYLQTYTLTKESDVYSFGVVLFEVLCGKLCYKHSNGQLQVFVSMWKERCKENKLAEIIFHDLKHQRDATSLEIFADSAYQCLRESRKQRPTMSQVVEKLDKALQVQEAYDEESQKSLREVKQVNGNDHGLRKIENQDLLIKWIEQDLGFSSGKPVAACFIYNSLLHWRSFEKVQDSNHALNYWLCNTSTLLTLLTRTFKATPQRPTSLFGRMSQKLRASPRSAGRTDHLRKVEAKYPALLFHEQLTDLLMKIYGMSRDNLKKELSPLLELCILAPRVSREAVAPWQRIVKEIDNHLETMKANFVTPFLVPKAFTQIFLFINVQLFNSLLLRLECCSFSNGEYVKAGLAEVEQWFCYATEEAVGFLVIHQKPKRSLKELTQELCPALSIQQLYRISTMYWDDKYGTHSLFRGFFCTQVISSMRLMMKKDSNNAASSSFLLDDDSSIPFNMDDISKYMPQVDTGNIELPPLIRENSGFAFLHQRTE
ncbi:myosin-17-like protein [Tanacetum coccineum]